MMPGQIQALQLHHESARHVDDIRLLMPTTSDKAEDLHDSNRKHIKVNNGKDSGFITNTTAVRREQQYLGMMLSGDQGVPTAPGTETKNLNGASLSPPDL